MGNNTENEEWRDIPNYEGYYQASNLGGVRSLDRTVTSSNGYDRFYKGRIREGYVDNGYRRTTLNIDGVGRNFQFSQLVAMAFLGHKPDGNTLIVDHINGDKSDDRVENLRIVTHRANTTICFRSNEESFSSEYAGVYWNEGASKWRTRIEHKGVSVHLGYYNTEIEASNTYQSALSKIEDGSFNPDDYKPDFSSKYKGVCFYKKTNKWRATITANGKQKHLGYFRTESEAHEAYKDKLNELNNKKRETHGC